MKKRVFVFPGQGSQIVGMGFDFAVESVCREVLEEAEDALNFKLGKLMAEGPQDVLTLTQNAQPALLVAGLMALAYVQKQAGKKVADLCGFVAGHSLGEYTAVAAAGGLDLASAVRLVRVRGEEMAKVSGGGMVAVLGLEPAVAASLEGDGVYFANDNSPGQAVFSGQVELLEDFENKAKNAGAKRCVRLAVSGAFHTPGMGGAAAAVRAFLADKPLNDLSVACVMNASALPETGRVDVSDGLVKQVTSRVKWRESMVFMGDNGVTEVVELGVGKVLAGLAGRCDARLTGVSLDSRAAVDGWLEAQA